MSGHMQALMYLDRGMLALEQAPVPICGDDDILVEVKAAGICGADLHWQSGAFSSDHPFILGHEFCGIVCQKGSRVSDRWKIGDRVVSDNTGDACGKCPACLRGDYAHCHHRVTIGGGMDGGFAKYCRIPGSILQLNPNGLMQLPEGISFEEGAIMEPAANAYRAVVQEARVRPGDTGVIAGLGPLGLFSLQIAKAAGASRIICLGMKSDMEKRFPLAELFGATHLIVSEETNVPDRVIEIVGDACVDVVLDAAGAPSVMNEAMEYLKHDGVFVRIGNPPAQYNYSLVPLIDKQITVIGHMGYNPVCWSKVMQMVKNGQLDLKSMIGTVLPLQEYEKAYRLMKTGQVAKAVLIPD